MAGKNGKVREIWGRQFTIVKDGLDEGEVFSFVGSIIERNNDYAEKLEHLDALTRLGESTVVEAEREAERIRLQAHEIASEEARTVVAEVEEKAKAAAQRIIAESEQLAQEMLKSAEETARVQAEKIIAEAEANIQARLSVVEQLAQDIIQGVETEAKRKAKEVKSKARKEAQISKRAAQQLLDRSKKLAQSEIRQKFEGVYQELISVLDPEGLDKLNVGETESCSHFHIVSSRQADRTAPGGQTSINRMQITWSQRTER